ncbi:putative 3-methyl-2-oxobutanoate hydroxymethyltransferase [Cyclospora cayetanensis]|uniref:3-methyl-2-oxobutanoate hydroxymethyltransferase n=1 Tax=Cyclospora cayetanensis TaxID=88456 RepID=A0A1D3CXT9_9EIME|nr:putative 3-methyl-2-oxobutanoate hydroxymethyltransferase [Cyclospora cayetanensis]
MSSFYGISGANADDQTWGPGACTSLHQMHGLKPITLSQVLKKKSRHEKIVMCTVGFLLRHSVQAYDLFTSRVADDAMVDILLVGDSLANVVLGESRTAAVDLDTMILFAKLVTKGTRRSLVVFDLPYGTYSTPEQAVAATIKVVQETGIQVVKLEGYLPEVEVSKYAAVCCHLGLLPQTATSFVTAGGTAEDAERLLQQALDLQDAGAAMLVLEMVCTEAAEHISRSLRIPTIGIGAGVGCDGQVLVIHDMLGLCGPGAAQYKFAKSVFLNRYANLYDMAVSALGTFRSEVVQGSFPQQCNSTPMRPGEGEKFADTCAHRTSTSADSSTIAERGGGISSSVTLGSTKQYSAETKSSDVPQETDSSGPYKVCVWGGGRMGQLFAWILAGSPQILATDQHGHAGWQQKQMYGIEVTICTSRKDLVAASNQNGGRLSVIRSHGPPTTSSSPSNDRTHSSTLASIAENPLGAAGNGEQRLIKVISHSTADKLRYTYDLVIIACHSAATQNIAESAFRMARAGGMVASLQNGLKAPRILRALHDRQLQSGGEPPALLFMPTSLAAVEKASASAAALDVACATMENSSSTLGQLQEGRPTELVDISGEVIREANLIGLKAPVNRLLLELIGLLESTQARRLCIS